MLPKCSFSAAEEATLPTAPAHFPPARGLVMMTIRCLASRLDAGRWRHSGAISPGLAHPEAACGKAQNSTNAARHFAVGSSVLGDRSRGGLLGYCLKVQLDGS